MCEKQLVHVNLTLEQNYFFKYKSMFLFSSVYILHEFKNKLDVNKNDINKYSYLKYSTNCTLLCLHF